MFKNKEQQFDFYWKEIFTGLAYNPIEFNTYRFDQTMSLPGKVNKLYDMFKILALNNQEVMDYLKEFMETFDFKLETTIKDILIVWLNEGLLADVVREAISEEVVEARTDYLGKKYVDLKERLDIEKAESLAKADEIESDIADVTTQLAQIAINITSFGASVNNTDNHNAIMSALDYLNDSGGGTLLVPTGIFKTSPLILNGYTNITIKGTSMPMEWNTASCFKIISTGDVGIQLSEVSGLGHVNETPTWYSNQITIENLRVDGNNMVNTCINGHYEVTLSYVNTENAIKDGIVLEPQTYPFTLRHVTSRNNGRHGVYVKAPYTTVYNLYNCELSRNDGYGLCIEDGTAVTIQDVLLQGNKQGGLKIEKKNPKLFTKPIFLSNLLFINLYTEQNGKLAESDLNFEGNCAVKTFSYNHERRRNEGKIAGLAFIKGTVSRSTTVTSSKTWELKGLMDLTIIGIHIPETAIDYNTCGTMGIATDIPTEEELENSYTTVANVPVNNETKNIRAMVGHGFIGKRGRMRELNFHLPASEIVAGSSILLKTTNGVLPFYSVLQDGSFYGINVYQRLAPKTGTLTFKIKYGLKSDGWVTNTFNSLPTIQLDNTKNYESLNFPLLKHFLNGGFIVGVEVTASADYTPLRTDDGFADIIFELFIES